MTFDTPLSRAERIRQKYINGASHAELAKEFGATKGYINKLVGRTVKRDRMWAKLSDIENQLMEVRVTLNLILRMIRESRGSSD